MNQASDQLQEQAPHANPLWPLKTAEKSSPRSRKTSDLYDSSDASASPVTPRDDQHRAAEERYWKRQVFWQATGAIATILAFFAAAIYASYAKQQIQSIQRQQNDNEAAQRAHLVIVDPITVEIVPNTSDIPPGMATLLIHFSLLNAGSSVANKIGILVDYTITRNTYGARNSSVGPNSAAPIVSQPTPTGGSIGGGETRHEACQLFVERDQADVIKNGVAWGYLQIIVSYVDIFGHSQAIADSVCYMPRSHDFQRCTEGNKYD